jgi:hypothetical protein
MTELFVGAKDPASCLLLHDMGAAPRSFYLRKTSISFSKYIPHQARRGCSLRFHDLYRSLHAHTDTINMSGIEVAGLVLGALPILLTGLQFYAKGTAMTMRYRRYSEEFATLIDELKGEHAAYQNSIETLLIGVVEPKDVAEFLANPGGVLWRTPTFERRLQKRLGRSHDPYLATVFQLRNTVEEFTKRLSLAELSQVRIHQIQVLGGTLLMGCSPNSLSRKPSKRTTSASDLV